MKRLVSTLPSLQYIYIYGTSMIHSQQHFSIVSHPITCSAYTLVAFSGDIFRGSDVLCRICSMYLKLSDSEDFLSLGF